MANFASVLLAARKDAGLKQSEVAAKAGLTSSYLSFLENRKKPPPSDEVCVKLSLALGLSPESLLEPAHLERAPEALRERVHSLQHSLRRERRSLRHFMEGLLSPFLFAGPPGYRESAIEALGVSPTRRKRIREAVRRGEIARSQRRKEIRNFLGELDEKELAQLADRLASMVHEQSGSEPPVLDAPPETRPALPFLVSIESDTTPDLKAGDQLLIDPNAIPRHGDIVYLTDGTAHRLVQEGPNYRFADRADEAIGAGESIPAAGSIPAAEMFHLFEKTLLGVALECRRSLRQA